MYVTYSKLCPLSSIITENVLGVGKPLQVMSFSPNSVNFLWLNLTKWTPHEGILVILLSCGSIWSNLTTKIPSCGVHLVRINHKN
ncbi:hypothetical protein Hanom_Chr00s003255g01710981 [Helianthus anomalus]